MKYLITGASGFWGRNVVEKILDIGEKGDITCIYYTNLSGLDGLDVKKIKMDLENPYGITKLDDDYDVIIHLASIVKHTMKDKERNIRKNVLSTNNVLELGKRISEKNKRIRIIIASSLGTVACSEFKTKYFDENSGYSERSIEFPYYKSKIEIEKMVDMYKENKNMEIVIIRPPVILGPNDLKGRATKRIRKFLESSIILYTCGNIPICDVRDLSQITYDLCICENPEKIYNIDGKDISIFEFYNELEKLTDTKKYKIYVPYWIGKILIPIFRKCLNIPDIIEFEMGNSYWNSKSLFFNDYKWIDYRKTLKDTINDIKSRL